MEEDFFERDDEQEAMEAMEDLFFQNLEFELTGSCLLTNISADKKPFILQAAQETGFNIYIENEAFGNSRYCDAKPISGLIAVYTCDHGKDHSKFWKRYDELVS